MSHYVCMIQEVQTADVPASWIMEGGELLPEPGGEAAWLERHRQRAE